MFDNLFNHQKLNYEISYRFRNKYFICFPIYFLFLCCIAILGSVFGFFINRNINLGFPIFFTFSKNQSKIAKLFNKSTFNFEINFSTFQVTSLRSSGYQNLIWFGLINGLRLKSFLMIFSINDFKFFKLNWFRICNLFFIEKILHDIKEKNNLVVIANDHSIYNNFIINWCKFNGLKTMYMQHAPVTEKFPPLRCDFNILFSKSSLDIYSKISKINVHYKLISDIRLIKYLELSKRVENNTRSILICTNQLDYINEVKKYVDYFHNLDYKITIRKHPADRRNWSFSNTFASTDDLYNDLLNNNIVLCNETALILEGIISDKLIYKCKFSEFFDNYGYLKDNLVLKEYTNLELLNIDINNKFVSYDKSILPYYIGDLNNYRNHIKEINKLINSNNK